MRFIPALILAFLPSFAFAQAMDDNAHRADRQQTERLNAGARDVIVRRGAVDAAKLARYREAQQAYEKQRAEWRRQVAACEAGDVAACNPS